MRAGAGGELVAVDGQVPPNLARHASGVPGGPPELAERRPQ